MLLIVTFILVGTILVIFAFPQFSPVLYFPSNRKDLPIILKALNLRKSQMIIDLGAGDGIVIFEAAKKSLEQGLHTKFIAVEINPVLVFILHIRRLLHPNRNKIKIVWADMFKLNIKEQIVKTCLPAGKGKDADQRSNMATFFVYISPWLLEKLVAKLKKNVKRFELVSYFYPIPNALSKKVQKMQGVNNLYKYTYI